MPVSDGYGSREGGFIAHQCPLGAYHITVEHLIVELIDDRAQPATGDQVGEIVLTHLDSFGMPLIRYRTGDLAQWAAPCNCGRGLATLRAIMGRRTDLLRRADGGAAHALSAIYVLRDEPSVAHFKIVQQADLSLDVKIVARPSPDSATRDRIVRRLQSQLGPLAIRITEVAEIPPDPSGKHRCVSQAAS